VSLLLLLLCLQGMNPLPAVAMAANSTLGSLYGQITHDWYIYIPNMCGVLLSEFELSSIIAQSYVKALQAAHAILDNEHVHSAAQSLHTACINMCPAALPVTAGWFYVHTSLKFLGVKVGSRKAGA
jgi:hypothetical protein